MTEDNDNAVLAIRDVWYAQAADKAMTLETLPAFLKELAEYKHDYNTICYALTAGAIATAWALNRTPNGGITGFQAGAIMVRRFGRNEAVPVVGMTKAEYAKVYQDQRGTFTAADGTFRVKICLNPHHTGPRYQAGWVAVFLTDSKVHPTPDSNCVLSNQTEAAE